MQITDYPSPTTSVQGWRTYPRSWTFLPISGNGCIFCRLWTGQVLARCLESKWINRKPPLWTFTLQGACWDPRPFIPRMSTNFLLRNPQGIHQFTARRRTSFLSGVQCLSCARGGALTIQSTKPTSQRFTGRTLKDWRGWSETACQSIRLTV